MIVTAELLKGLDSTKFIPVVRDVSGADKLPTFLGSRLYIDLSKEKDNDNQRLVLLKEIHKVRDPKPLLGKNPFAKSTDENFDYDYKDTSLPDLKVDSTVLFSERFAAAFPGIRGTAHFENEKDIKMRMCELLKAPLHYKNSSPIWWWRGGNLSIHRFIHLDKRLFLMNSDELNIRKIIAVNAGSYYQQFVYVEIDKMEPTGLYPKSYGQIESSIKTFGYSCEEYGLYKGKTKITRAEYDDNSALIDGELTKLGENSELRVRYITPYNFLIAPNSSPINNNSFDEKLEELLNGVLQNRTSIDVLKDKVIKLPKREI